jgi:hypothetical protein
MGRGVENTERRDMYRQVWSENPEETSWKIYKIILKRILRNCETGMELSGSG